MSNVTSPGGLARALGYASFASAAAEVAAPGWLCARMGLTDHTGLLRALGARETAAGIGILAVDNPEPGVWSRVAGDAMDLALLGAAARETTRPRGLAVAAALVAGITALDVWCAVALRRGAAGGAGGDAMGGTADPAPDAA